jgi:two-component system, NarL family, invasion response regulator UvrY
MESANPLARSPSPSHANGPWRLLVVDDHALCCAGMAMMFRTVPEVAEVAVASHPEQALRIATLFRPDLALVDFTMPEHGGLETARRLLTPSSRCRVLFLDDEVEHGHVRSVLRLGASGYWTKHATFDEIAVAVADAIVGRQTFCPAVEEHMIRTPVGLWYRPSLIGTPLETLTSRELEVLVHLTDGLSIKQCADEMSLLESTVAAHRTRLMRKLNVPDVVELVKLAARKGLLDWANGYGRPATEG